jgi:hypothetical protein
MAIELWDFRSDVGQERADLRGMSVEALDGSVGKVEEVVQEPSASFLVVDTGPWILGKKVLLPAGLVSGIDVDDEVVKVERYKDEIKGAPEFDDERHGEPAYRDALTRHYGAAQPKA